MVYNINDYRHSITPQIKLWCESRPGVSPISQISNLALVTSCPIVIVCQLIEEIYGSTPELTSQIERLKEFYK